MTGERLALWWVDLYTRGLPETARESRRAEIASDVWEHSAAGGHDRSTQLAIASRCLRGALADASWRRAQRRGRRHVPSHGSVVRGLGWAVAASAFGLLVLMHAWNATALVGLHLYGQDWDPGDVTATARVSALLLVVLAGGALLLPRRPRLGATLVSLGALATTVWAWCIVALFGPIATAVIVAAIVLARRRRRTTQLRASSATS